MIGDKEFRWEFVGIGQGHYYTTLSECINGALEGSKSISDREVMVEIFKPMRMELCRIQNGEELISS